MEYGGGEEKEEEEEEEEEERGERGWMGDSTEEQLEVKTEEAMIGIEVTTVVIILGFRMEIKEVMIETIIIAIIVVALLDHLMKTVEEAMIMDLGDTIQRELAATRTEVQI